MKTLAMAVCLVGFATPAMACMFDTDCAVGSKCIKPGGGLYGMCAGGLSPGNAHDDVPVRDPLDLNGTTGNTCQFDLDCGIGAKCLKGSGIYGVCIGR